MTDDADFTPPPRRRWFTSIASALSALQSAREAAKSLLDELLGNPALLGAVASVVGAAAVATGIVAAGPALGFGDPPHGHDPDPGVVAQLDELDGQLDQVVDQLGVTTTTAPIVFPPDEVSGAEFDELGDRVDRALADLAAAAADLRRGQADGDAATADLVAVVDTAAAAITQVADDLAVLAGRIDRLEETTDTTFPGVLPGELAAVAASVQTALAELAALRVDISSTLGGQASNASAIAALEARIDALTADVVGLAAAQAATTTTTSPPPPTTTSITTTPPPPVTTTTTTTATTTTTLLENGLSPDPPSVTAPPPTTTTTTAATTTTAGAPPPFIDDCVLDPTLPHCPP